MNSETCFTKDQALAQAEASAACVLTAGILLMEAGAEVYRIEETMTRMAYSITGVDYATSYVTVTGVFCTIEVGGQTITRMARIKHTGRNLGMVAAVNALSRDMEKKHYQPEQLMKKLVAIEKMPVYSDWTKALWGAAGALGFVIFFGGGWQEMGFVFLIGLVLRYATVLFSHMRINDFFVNVVLSFLAAVLSELFADLCPQASVSIMIISSIMLLVPGLMITNALRDSVMGEPLSALVLIMQSLLISSAIAAGVMLGLEFMRIFV